MFELFIARRYLNAKRKQVVISLITVISVIGVAAGVMALVIALAVNNGLRDTLQRNLLGATAHVSILEKEPSTGIEDWEKLVAPLARIPHVKTAAPALYESGYLSGPVQGKGVAIKGVDLRVSTPDALKHLKTGSLETLRATNDLPNIVLGKRLAQDIGAMAGNQVQLVVPNGQLTPFGPRPSYVRMRVAGTFETGFFDVDTAWAFLALPEAQRAFGLTDVVNSVELTLDDIYQAPQVAAASSNIIGPKLVATTWGEQNRQLLNAFTMERRVTWITISLIQLVAALNILITLIMMVMEKHRDIAILMSMGAKARQIRSIFIFEGALIGGIGAITGLLAGHLLCYFANRYQWIKLDEAIYSVGWVPFEPRVLDSLWIAALAIVVSLLATLYPALNATRIAPVEALRYE